jgi:hypothetical protein
MLLTMTENELNRIKIIQDVCDKQITGVEAAHRLNLVLFFNKKAEENLDLI